MDATARRVGWALRETATTETSKTTETVADSSSTIETGKQYPNRREGVKFHAAV